jgi:hypothetical protein
LSVDGVERRGHGALPAITCIDLLRIARAGDWPMDCGF